MVHVNWKKTIIAALDVLLAVYLVFAITSFSEPAKPEAMFSSGMRPSGRFGPAMAGTTSPRSSSSVSVTWR